MNIYSHLWFLAFCSYCVLVNGYLNVRLEDDLCVAGGKNSGITLLDDDQSAAIFTQQWNSTSSNKIRYDCEFVVLSNRDAYRIPRGTYTVITRLNFRKNPRTNECLDYIELRENGSPNKRVCGNNLIEGNTDDFIFDLRRRDITIIIHIDATSEISEPLELRMVMTAHSQCNHKGDFLCNDNDPYSCISRLFKGDNVTNCNAPCRDEAVCFQENVKPIQTNDEIIKPEKRVVERISSRFGGDDDSSGCITVKILEEKLKENTQALQVYIKNNEASLLDQIDVRISDSKNNIPPYGVDEDVEDDSAKCITVDILESKLQKNTERILSAMSELEKRLTSKIEVFFDKYQKDALQNLATIPQSGP